MHTIADIISFIEKETYSKGITPDDDLYKKHGIVGDDLYDLLVAFSEKYQVDMRGCHLEYHTHAEGQMFTRLFPVKAPGGSELIPITPQTLLDSAHEGKWTIKYPEEALKKYLSKKKDNSVLKLTLLLILVVLIAFIVTIAN